MQGCAEWALQQCCAGEGLQQRCAGGRQQQCCAGGRLQQCCAGMSGVLGALTWLAEQLADVERVQQQ